MRIIDEKGRLFGRINIIDFLVIVFLLSLAPMFYFGYKVSNQRGIEKKRQQVESQRTKEFIKILINCKFVKLTPAVLKVISVGDKELDNYGNTVGEIVRLGEFSPYFYKFDVGSSRELIQEDPGLMQVEATLKINAQIKGKNIYYKDKQILEGDTFEFYPGKYSLIAENIAILTDNDSALIDTTAQNVGIGEERLEAIKKEFESQLGNLEIKMNSLIELLTDKTSKLETKTSELESKVNLLKANKKNKKWQ